MTTALAIFAVLLLCVAIYVVTAYNELNSLRERVKNAFSQIDVQLERRYDMIPNLVEVVSGYMSHEQTTLEEVMNARAKATMARVSVNGDPSNTGPLQQLGSANNSLTSALGRLLAVSEAYPDLKADSSVSELMEELSNTENRVAFARQGFNDEVRIYQTFRGSFPPVLFASALGFRPLEYLDGLEEEKRETPAISLDR